MLNLDLSSPDLRKAVKALAPMNLRLGGSLTDTVRYAMEDSDHCADFSVSNATILGFELSGSCLRRKRWDELLDFCVEAGCHIVLDVNALEGRQKPQCPAGTDCFNNRAQKCCSNFTGSWDPRNFRQFLHYTAKRPNSPVFGFEFGNELAGNGGIEAHLTPEVYAKDLKHFALMIREVYPDPETRPRILAPGSTLDVEWFSRLLELAHNDIDVVTHHMYSLGAGIDPEVSIRARSPGHLDQLYGWANAAASVVQNYNTELWVGEAGGAYNSGRHKSTDAFLSGFWYNDNMAILAQNNHKAFCRQTLVGGNYGLLDAKSLKPNPDFYSALLWRRLMGAKVLNVTVDDVWGVGADHSRLRAYAHCTHHQEGDKNRKGDVTFLLLNLGKNNIGIGSLESTFGNKVDKELWSLTAPYLESNVVFLNHKLLYETDGLKPKKLKSNDKVQLKPYSQNFLVVRGANWPACRA
jgi:heparanase 1